jgi:TetR/AcrR family transcriptional regulator, transcriptional repressor for nem operon
VGRAREFDEDAAMDAVANVFSTHGFNGTSMKMLVDATQVAKQSLYNAFGDKEAMYLLAIDRAASRFGSRVREKVDAAKTGRAAIECFFKTVTAACESESSCERACIVSSGLLEDIEAERINAVLQGKWAVTHELFRSLVERGQKDGSIRNHAPTVLLADYLMTAMSGLRVAAQSRDSQGRLAETARMQLRILDVT